MRSRRPSIAAAVVALVSLGAGLAVAPVPVRAGLEAGEKYALLVGVAEPEGEPTAQAVGRKFGEADVIGLAEVLRRELKIPGDHIVLMTRRESAESGPRRLPTRANILAELGLLASGLREPDTLIVSMAGPGAQRKEDAEPSFWPIDARPDDPRTWISLGEIRRTMERSRAGFKLLFVDAGRGDPQDAGPSPRVESSIAITPASAPPTPTPTPMRPGGVDRTLGLRSVVTFLSCARGERAFEDPPTGLGVFHRFLIDGLGGQADLDGDGLGTLGELQTFVFRNVRNLVRDRYAALQQPELIGSGSPNEILVAHKPTSLLLKQSRDLLARRKFDEVITACTRLLQFDPRLAEAYHLRGKARLMESAEEAAAAIADFTQAIRFSPEFTEAYFDRGLLAMEIGETDAAIADFNESMRQGMTGKDVWFFRGLAWMQKNRYPEANADFTQSIRLDPNFSDAYLNRGVARFRLDLLKEALADDEKAIALDPRMARAYLNRGVVRLTLGDLDGAVTDFDTAIQQARRSGDTASIGTAYFDRGRAFFLKKDYPRAISDWERVAKDLDQRDCMTLDFLGLAHAQLQNEMKATRYFEDAVRLDDARGYAPAHVHLAGVRYNQKDFEGAIRECTAAIEIDGNSAEAYTTRSLAYRALMKLDKSQADARQAELLRKRRPENPAERRDLTRRPSRTN